MSEQLTVVDGGGEPRRALPTVPVAELAVAQDGVKRAARELVSAATELGQLALLEEVPFEADVAQPEDEIRKRYTGTNGARCLERRAAVVKMLSYHINVSVICDVLRMSHHTVEAIAAQETQAIAVFSEMHAGLLAADAMADIAVARTKRDTASFKDLHIAAGIKLTHAQSLKLAGAGAVDDGNVIQLEEENPKLEAARRFLQNRASAECGMRSAAEEKK
jgi:hypothetical protein